MSYQPDLPGLERDGFSHEQLLETIHRKCAAPMLICWPGYWMWPEQDDKNRSFWIQSAELASRLGYGDKGHWHLSRRLTALGLTGDLEVKVFRGMKWYRPAFE